MDYSNSPGCRHPFNVYTVHYLSQYTDALFDENQMQQGWNVQHTSNQLACSSNIPVHKSRLCLNVQFGAAGLSKRRLAADAAVWHEELDAEIDEELADNFEQDREEARRQGLRLAVVETSEEDALPLNPATDGPQGVQRALQATARRTAQRQLLSQQWIKFAQEHSTG